MSIRFFRQTITVLASAADTQGALGVFEVASPIGDGPPLHVHRREVCAIPGTTSLGGDTGGMAFGQQAGPPASRCEVEKLLTLLQDAGHTDFRDARGPMGFTQRQAAGKFTRDEAAAFIAQLEETETPGEAGAPPAASNPRLSAAEQALRRMPAELLAAELQRRGWVVVQP